MGAKARDHLTPILSFIQGNLNEKQLRKKLKKGRAHKTEHQR